MPGLLKATSMKCVTSTSFPNVPGFICDERGEHGRLCLVRQIAERKAEKITITAKSLIDQKKFTKFMKVDAWDEVVIVAQDNRIQHYLNGTRILNFTDNHPELALAEGIIALQLHAGKPMWAEFKGIKIRELNLNAACSEAA